MRFAVYACSLYDAVLAHQLSWYCLLICRYFVSPATPCLTPATIH